MQEFEIVPIKSKDEMNEKGYVHWKSWQETYSGLMPEEYLQSITMDKCVKVAHNFPQNTMLLKVEGKIVGFSCFKEGEAANEILALYLLKEYQGKKLGYKLLQTTFEQIQNNQKTTLWVLKGNDRAINFYKRYGFVFTGKEKTLPFGVELQMEINQ